MTMPTMAEAEATACECSPFSNSDGDAWIERNCGRCVHDAPTRRDDWGGGCPLLLLAYTERTPSQWKPNPDAEGIADAYVCDLFAPES